MKKGQPSSVSTTIKSIVQHRGQIFTSGHFSCVVKENGKYVVFGDSACRSCSRREPSTNAYIVIYVKSECTKQSIVNPVGSVRKCNASPDSFIPNRSPSTHSNNMDDVSHTSDTGGESYGEKDAVGKEECAYLSVSTTCYQGGIIEKKIKSYLKTTSCSTKYDGDIRIMSKDELYIRSTMTYHVDFGVT